MSDDERIELKCPAEGCDGLLKVSQSLPAGEYQCKCHHVWVKLSWANYLVGGRRPYLQVVEKAKRGEL